MPGVANAPCSVAVVTVARFTAARLAPARHELKLSRPLASGTSPAASGESTMSSERAGGAYDRRSDVRLAPRMQAR